MTLQDYIQKEIERLEAMKEDVVGDLEMNFNIKKVSKNKVIQTIIDIKRKELEELNKS